MRRLSYIRCIEILIRYFSILVNIVMNYYTDGLAVPYDRPRYVKSIEPNWQPIMSVNSFHLFSTKSMGTRKDIAKLTTNPTYRYKFVWFFFKKNSVSHYILSDKKISIYKEDLWMHKLSSHTICCFINFYYFLNFLFSHGHL